MSSENGYGRRSFLLAAASGAGLAVGRQAGASRRTQSGPPGVEWTREFLHESGEILAMHVVEASDGGYALGGQVIDDGVRKMSVVRTDDRGEPQWRSVVDDGLDPTRQETRAIVETTDGGFVVVGYGGYEEEPADYRAHTAVAVAGKVDPGGDVRWVKTFDAYEPDDEDDAEPELGKEDSAMFLDAHATSDGGVVAVGYRNQPPWAVKLDADGKTVWDLEHPERNMFQQVLAPDGGDGVVLVASPSDEDPYHAVHVGTDGAVVKTVQLDVEYDEVIWGHRFSSPDSGYTYTGQHRFGRDMVLGRLDASGASRWIRTYDGPAGGTDWGMDVTRTPDGGFVVSGFMEDPPGEPRPALLKTASDGTKEWQQILHEPREIVGDTGFARVVRTSDGGFVALARPWVVKFGPHDGGGGSTTTTREPTTTTARTTTATTETNTTSAGGPGLGVLGALGGLLGGAANALFRSGGSDEE